MGLFGDIAGAFRGAVDVFSDVGGFLGDAYEFGQGVFNVGQSFGIFDDDDLGGIFSSGPSSSYRLPPQLPSLSTPGIIPQPAIPVPVATPFDPVSFRLPQSTMPAVAGVDDGNGGSIALVAVAVLLLLLPR